MKEFTVVENQYLAATLTGAGNSHGELRHFTVEEVSRHPAQWWTHMYSTNEKHGLRPRARQTSRTVEGDTEYSPVVVGIFIQWHSIALYAIRPTVAGNPVLREVIQSPLKPA